jgi:hypothetical protein
VVAHPLWERGVAGSSPAAPTSKDPNKDPAKCWVFEFKDHFQPTFFEDPLRSDKLDGKTHKYKCRTDSFKDVSGVLIIGGNVKFPHGKQWQNQHTNDGR